MKTTTPKSHLNRADNQKKSNPRRATRPPQDQQTRQHPDRGDPPQPSQHATHHQKPTNCSKRNTSGLPEGETRTSGKA